MTKRITAVYDHGVLRLPEGLDLHEGQEVTVYIQYDTGSPSQASPKAILDRISSLAEPHHGDHFSGQDHDAVLYGKSSNS